MPGRERPWRTRPHRALWRLLPSGGPRIGWFWSRFLEAASVVVVRWAPRSLADRTLLGRPAGVWLLVVAWAMVPVWLMLGVARHLGALGGP